MQVGPAECMPPWCPAFLSSAERGHSQRLCRLLRVCAKSWVSLLRQQDQLQQEAALQELRKLLTTKREALQQEANALAAQKEAVAEVVSNRLQGRVLMGASTLFTSSEPAAYAALPARQLRLGACSVLSGHSWQWLPD